MADTDPTGPAPFHHPQRPVAIVVLMDAEGIDGAESARVAEVMVTRALVGDEGPDRAVPIKMLGHSGQEWTGTVHAVVSLRRAVRDGFIDIGPTRRAWPNQEENRG